MPDYEGMIKTYETLKSNRSVWDQHYEEIAEVMLPSHRGFVGDRTKGEKRSQKVFDSKPIMALSRFASVMDSMLTPRQTMWHGVKATDPYLNNLYEVREYHEEINRILFAARYQYTSGFSGQNPRRWVSLGAFGTGVIFTDYEAGLRYRNISLKDCFIMENHQGLVDSIYRRVMLTARQAAQKFKKERLHPKIIAALENPQRYCESFEFVHVVIPNDEYVLGNIDYTGKPYYSVYLSMDSRDSVSDDTGYDTFPFSISRYSVAPDEMYGRGPGVQALADVKMLNQMAKTDIAAVHKLVNPPLLLHNDGMLGNGRSKVNLAPGALNYGGVSKDGRQLVQPLITNARVDIAEAKMQQRRAAIDDAFLVTLFQILVETPRMTATEALIRAQEKGMLLTPTLGRQQSEALGPLIERELELLANNLKLPPAPPVLVEAGAEYEITYDSPLNRMQQKEELVAIQTTMELLTPFAQINPNVMDIFDPDQLAEVTARVSGVPANVMRSPKEIAEIRRQREDEQQLQLEASMMQPIAGAMKDVAQAQHLTRGV